MAFNFTTQTMLIIRALLGELGEEMLLSLPQIDIVRYLEQRITDLEGTRLYLSRLANRTRQSLQGVDDSISAMSVASVRDLNTLKFMTGALTKRASVNANMGYEAMTAVMAYKPLASKRNVLSLELANIEKRIDATDTAVINLRLAISRMTSISGIVEDTRGLIHDLNRHGLSSSCIMDLDDSKLKTILESGELKYGGTEFDSSM